jgi:hypothetical protein
VHQVSFALIGLKLLGFGRGIIAFWQLVSMALAVFALIQHFQLADARHDRDSYHKQRDAAQAELKAISTKRNEQKITSNRIVIAQRKAKDADGVAKKIEAAPHPTATRPAETSRATQDPRQAHRQG